MKANDVNLVDSAEPTYKPGKANKIFVLYHDPCTDGMGAKYAAWKKFGGGAKYIGVDYKKPAPVEVMQADKDTEVYIVDFAYPKDILREIYTKAAKLVVLDHHKTAQEALAGEPYAIFDMNRSGAVLAWEYFFPDQEVPTLLQMIQDRDLWKWQISGSRNVLNYLELFPQMETWDTEFVPLRGDVYRKGTYISMYQDALIEKALNARNLKFFEYGDATGAITNSTVFPSEIGNLLCVKFGVDIAITYTIGPGGEVFFSFRSNRDGSNYDVSILAKLYGGGGHRNAAGAAKGTLRDLMGFLDRPSIERKRID